MAGRTFPNPPNIPHPGRFDYEEEIQTETLPGIRVGASRGWKAVDRIYKKIVSSTM